MTHQNYLKFQTGCLFLTGSPKAISSSLKLEFYHSKP